MNLERRLKGHFDAVGGRVGEPDFDVERVMQRGRRRRRVQMAAMGVNMMVVVLAAVVGFRALTAVNVDFAPAAPQSNITAAPSATPEPTPSAEASEAAPTPSPFPPSSTQRPAEGSVDSIDPGQLGTTVVAYGAPRGDGLRLIDSAGSDVTWPGGVALAIPDGRGGIVVQAASGDVVWLPLDGRASVSLDQIKDPQRDRVDVVLRTVEKGSVIFSTHPRAYRKESVVNIFSVGLEGGQPELLGTEGAYESWFVGPVTTVEGRLLASCHLLCSLSNWPNDGRGKPVHGQGADVAIEALDVADGGDLVALLESNEMTGAIPQLVVLDVGTWKELLRLPLPVDETTRSAGAVISMSSDGGRILVSLDSPTRASQPVPRTTFLVDAALGGKPLLRRVDYPGVVRWLDPAAASR